MKDWDYYSKPKAAYFSFEEEKAYKQKLTDEINESKMTAAERTKALAELKGKVRQYETEYNKPYKEEQAKLTDEFWADAREELGYESFLDEDGVTALESKAYEDGHSSGYSEVFCVLGNLVEFAEAIVKGAKKGKTK